MAHPAREGWAEDLATTLGCGITWDERNNVWDTARRTWLAFDPDATHHLVVQDDAIVCLDLPATATVIAGLFPSRPVTLTAIDYRLGNLRDGYLQAERAERTFFYGRRAISTVALMVPTKDIPGMVAWCDRATSQHDDVRIMNYWRHRNVDTAFTIPSLVDHRDVDTNPTLVAGNDRAWKSRAAYGFIGKDVSGLSVPWARPARRQIVTQEGCRMATATFARVSDPTMMTTVEVGSASYRRIVDKLSHAWRLVSEDAPPDPEGYPVRYLLGVEDVNAYHVGAGWYQLPNGDKVRGRDAAEAALA